MMNEKKIVAIIPARGGSKGIPGKNICLLKGKPLLAYAIEVGLTCGEIDRVIVSTDSSEIAKIASYYGAEVPFLRPEELAQDDTPDGPVFIHLIEYLEKNEAYTFDFLINLRCTTPLKKPFHIREALKIIATEDCTSVRTVDRIEGKHHPFWTLRRNEEGFGIPFIDGKDIRKNYYRRQLLPPAYSINALVDAMKVDVILHNENFYGEKMRLLETDSIYSIDIDTPIDLIRCESLMETIK